MVQNNDQSPAVRNHLKQGNLSKGINNKTVKDRDLISYFKKKVSLARAGTHEIDYFCAAHYLGYYNEPSLVKVEIKKNCY